MKNNLIKILLETTKKVNNYEELKNDDKYINKLINFIYSNRNKDDIDKLIDDHIKDELSKRNNNTLEKNKINTIHEKINKVSGVIEDLADRLEKIVDDNKSDNTDHKIKFFNDLGEEQIYSFIQKFGNSEGMTDLVDSINKVLGSFNKDKEEDKSTDDSGLYVPKDQEENFRKLIRHKLEEIIGGKPVNDEIADSFYNFYIENYDKYKSVEDSYDAYCKTELDSMKDTLNKMFNVSNNTIEKENEDKIKELKERINSYKKNKKDLNTEINVSEFTNNQIYKMATDTLKKFIETYNDEVKDNDIMSFIPDDGTDNPFVTCVDKDDIDSLDNTPLFKSLNESEKERVKDIIKRTADDMNNGEIRYIDINKGGILEDHLNRIKDYLTILMLDMNHYYDKTDFFNKDFNNEVPLIAFFDMFTSDSNILRRKLSNTRMKVLQVLLGELALCNKTMFDTTYEEFISFVKEYIFNEEELLSMLYDMVYNK